MITTAPLPTVRNHIHCYLLLIPLYHVYAMKERTVTLDPHTTITTPPEQRAGDTTNVTKKGGVSVEEARSRLKKGRSSSRRVDMQKAREKIKAKAEIEKKSFLPFAARDRVKHDDNGTLDDDDQRDGLEFAMEDIESFHNVSPGEHINVIPLRTFDLSIGLDVIYPPILLSDKEVEHDVERSGGVRRTNRASFRTSHGISEDASPRAQEVVPALNVQSQDIDDGRNSSDGNVDPYHEARVGNTVGDVLERDLIPFVPRPYYIPYPYDEGSSSDSPPYTKDNWEEIHGVNLGLQKKELYKDPKVCKTMLDRFPTPAETHWLREISSVKLSN
ncbi:hypothetical protein Tco_1410079 [Tanacetum coccineum]